ncbi:unnamed protein product [Vitrella brassicaformis CCMP3155]|uniref:Uncharacterized protein n=1 Tax=Vitrella brassicaformis (strain CCMP3155) TaxID=1169540 RepID=A0A0G4EM53_VITBC|nr:unnamed protein product [Vitrella brassicaformis CCMP3155]|eukprot:CEL98044.1 unnamed protein product [Vitrella brassicaformis CCMP3155]
MMAQREHQRAGERRQRQESVLRQGESRTRLRVSIEEQVRQVAHQLQLQQPEGGRQGQAELPARVPTRETADYGARFVPDQTVDAAPFLDGPAAGGLPVSVNRRTEYQGTNQRNGADLFSKYTQVRGAVGYGRLTGRDDDVRGGYGDGHMTGHPYQYTRPPTSAAYDAYEFAYPYLRPEEPQRPAGYPSQMSREAQQYGSGRLTSTGQNDAYGGAPLSTRPHRYDGRLPSYSQHQTNHGLSWDGVGGQPDYSSRRAYRAPSNISKVSKSSVVSRGTQCSIMTTQTALGPQNTTRGASRHYQQQQQQQRPIDHAGLEVEATASSVGRYAPPPDTHNTHNGQDNGSGGGFFGGMFSGLGFFLGGGRAAGAVREETRASRGGADRRSNRRHIDDDRYAYGAQGGSYESRYHREPKMDRQQAIEAYARELDNWKGFWEMELQERSEIQERLRRQLEERAAEREKKMERFHRQEQEKMEREWREVEAKKDEMRRKEQELEEKKEQLDQQLQQLQHQMQQRQRLNSDNETADNQQQTSTSDTVPPTPTGAVQAASKVAEGDATGERQRTRQMLQELENSPHFCNFPPAPGQSPAERRRSVQQ